MDLGVDIAIAPVVADLEAEDCVITPAFSIVTDPSASAGQYVIDTNPNGATGPGSVTCTVTLTTSGDYFIWGRTFALDGGSDSLTMSLDGGSDLLFPTGQCNLGPQWRWAALQLGATCPENLTPSAISLAPGQHTIQMKSREGQSVIDRLRVSIVESYRPTD